jgi:hypothetical protein
LFILALSVRIAMTEQVAANGIGIGAERIINLKYK